MKIELTDNELSIINIGLQHYIDDLKLEQYQQAKKTDGVSTEVYNTLIAEVKKLKNKLD
jgi:hypothetical protein